MTTSPRLKGHERFTYADYLTWPDDERWEIIYGVVAALLFVIAGAWFIRRRLTVKTQTEMIQQAG